MAYLTYTESPIGAFVEKSVGNTFEFSTNDEQGEAPEWPHRVWVASGKIAHDSGWRYARVMKTVAYIVVDENDYGEAVVEKWDIKNYRTYQ
jgi:hypothetical protein